MSQNLGLNLIPARVAASSPVVSAWYLPGGDAHAWLGELTDWNVDLATLTLFPIPTSARDRSAQGLLVIAMTSINPSGTPSTARVSPWARPCQLLQHAQMQLFFPASCQLEPEITKEELANHLVGGEVYWLSPESGLVGFTKEDGLRIVDLLVRPTMRISVWNQARSGPAPWARLTAVRPGQTLTVADLLASVRQELGGTPQAPLPPVPGEPPATKNIFSAISRFLQEQGLHLLEWLSRAPPPNPRTAQTGKPGATTPINPRKSRNSKTWRERLAAWSGDRLRALRNSLDDARQRELHRLLHLLASDPDQGLRYALPLGGLDVGRGIAPPSTSLGTRDVNFNLHRTLGGSRPVDPWNTSAEMTEKLRHRYRELANRELQLKRYRRAAYIFAELLGDAIGAANVLMQGNHFHEAAVLFQERLRRPLDAARCYQKGGLLQEAIEIYLEQGEYEMAGDLWRQMEQPSRATSAYRLAASKCLAVQDYLNAARLLDEKLAQINDALAVLREAWPRSQQATACLQARFSLLGKWGRHDEAKQLLESLRVEARAVEESITAALVNTLIPLPRDYPDRLVQRQASDLLRVVVGNYLTQNHHRPNLEYVRDWTRAIASLAPTDQILDRDAQRYRQMSQAKVPARPGRGSKASAECLRVHSLPNTVAWQSLVVVDNDLVALGIEETTLPRVAAARLHLDGGVQQLYLEPRLPNSGPLVFTTNTDNPCHLLVHGAVVEFPLVTRDFPIATPFKSTLNLGGLPWLPRAVRALAYKTSVALWLIREQDQLLLLESYDNKGVLLGSRDLAIDPSAGSPFLLATHEALYAGGGDRLFVYPATADNANNMPFHHRFSLTTPILGLSQPPGAPTRRVLITLEEGFAFLLTDRAQLTVPFCLHLSRPLATFAHSGVLVTASATEGAIFRYTTNDKITYMASFDGWNADPVALAPMPVRDQIVLLTRTGQIRVYRVRS